MWVDNPIADKENPDGSNIQTGLGKRIGWAWQGLIVVFPTPDVTYNKLRGL
jgi:hypothetical protein